MSEFETRWDGLLFICGPCVIESERHALEVASALGEIAKQKNIQLVYKSSFDKANRTSGASYRGPGLAKGLDILAKVKEQTGLPLLTDVHEPSHCAIAAEVVDILQIPAFLCRQTDLLEAAAKTGKLVNVKKGQFLSPWEAENIVKKVQEAGGVCSLTERGSSFGYNNLVVDFRSLPIMSSYGVPVIFDGTHAVQMPGGGGHVSGGTREYIPHLARAAAAVGVDGFFLEVHPDPPKAKSDSATQYALKDFPALVDQLLAIDAVRRGA